LIAPGNGTTLQKGEAKAPLPGEFRLLSDALLARDSRTACQWQSFVDDHKSMVSQFEAAMKKMSLLGHKESELTDCSEVIPKPKAATSNAGFIPAGKTLKDIQQSCPGTPFPPLTVLPGPETSIPRVPS